MDFLVLTKSGGFFGFITDALGFVMDKIFSFLELIGMPNIGLSIVLFTILMYVILMPLTYKQQKFTKVQSLMSPEINALNKKYKNKNDQASMLKKQEEMKAIYSKYGVSTAGGCLVSLIQLPILFSLYGVIQNIPAYITPIYDIYNKVAEKIMAVDGAGAVMTSLIDSQSIRVSNFAIENGGKVIDVLYRLKGEGWDSLKSAFESSPEVINAINNAQPELSKVNSIIGGLNVVDTPVANGIWPGIIIVILAGLTQFISIKVSSSNNSAATADNPMAGSMKTMMYTMPIISLVMAWTLQTGLGIYWIASAVVRTLIAVIQNKIIDIRGIDKIIEKNREKAQRKAEKRGDKPSAFEKYANVNTKKIEELEKMQKNQQSIKDIAKTSVDKENPATKGNSGSTKSGGGSISNYANLLKKKD